MTIGQNQKGTTVNASISVLPSGQFLYTFNDPFNMLVNLTNATGISVAGSNADDQFNLLNATGLTINGGSGNDTFSIAASVGSLNGNLIRGGGGDNLVQVNGSGADVDLTGLSFGAGLAASNIEMVVGRIGLTGETAELSLAQLATSSLNDGNGKAFVAVLGRDSTVNVTAPGKLRLVGEVDANGVAYDPNGNVLPTGALSSMVTSVTNVEGSLAADYYGAYNKVYDPATMTYLPAALNAYVFSDGATNYTVWSDGTVKATAAGTTTTAYQPATPTLVTPPALGTFTQFHQYDTDPSYKFAVGTLGVNPAGLTTLLLSSGQSLAYAATLANGVTGTVIRGASGPAPGGPNGGNWFGLGPSGGNNTVIGSPAGDIFDLQNSGALIDILKGSTGFDVVRAKNPNGTPVDVDLTSGNPTTGIASRFIDGVVGSNNNVDTVEVDLGTLNVADDGGYSVSVFEAMLGGAGSTLTISAAPTTHWLELATFGPGAPLPAFAQPIENAAVLDALYGPGKYTAENSLTGYLFEQVNGKGTALKYVTVYTDGTLVDNLSPPKAAAMADAMASMGAPAAAANFAAVGGVQANNAALTLAHPVA